MQNAKPWVQTPEHQVQTKSRPQILTQTLNVQPHTLSSSLLIMAL